MTEFFLSEYTLGNSANYENLLDFLNDDSYIISYSYSSLSSLINCSLKFLSLSYYSDYLS